MPERQIPLPEFGSFLAGLRESMLWKQSQAADIAARRGIVVTRQALRGLEKGRTKGPDPVLLRAIAALYRVPYEELVRRFVAERYGIDFGSADVTASIEKQLAALQERIVLEQDERELIDQWRTMKGTAREKLLAFVQEIQPLVKQQGTAKKKRRRA